MISQRWILLLIVVLLFSAHVSFAWAERMHEDAQQISSVIADWLDPDQAIFLEIRCGEWTSALAQSMRETLLERSFDLRELRSGQVPGAFEWDTDPRFLEGFGLQSAVLVTIELNLKWQTIEHKSFFSYRSERVPVQSFIVKQVQLPGQKLLRIDNYDFVQSTDKDTALSAPRLQWFEPLVVSTALASIIFLLWTIE